MILLDAYPLVALLADEPAADDVERLMREDGAQVTVFNLAEAVDVTQRVHELAADEVRAALEPLLGDVVRVVIQGENAAWRAGEIRMQYYDRRTCPLSLADCFLLAAAGPDDQVATADPSLAETARSERIAVIALRDRAGKRP